MKATGQSPEAGVWRFALSVALAVALLTAFVILVHS
jgi:hypothetical protein